MNYSLVAGIHSKEKVVNFYFDGKWYMYYDCFHNALWTRKKFGL